MLRLLGILSLGHLLFGGRHHRLRRGIFLGGLLGFLASRHFDTDRAAEDVRKAAWNARRTARDAARTARDAARTARREIRHAMHDRKVDEIHEKIDARRAEREERLNALHAEIEARKARRAEAREAEVQNAEVRSAEIRSTALEHSAVRALPVCNTNEAKEIRELAEGLERDARTAAMAADVPTIDFPDEDGKYFSSGKYGYA